jgi:iron complex transport system ATP-binding protein
MTDILLNVENVSGGYGERDILRGVNLTLKSGDFLGVIGPNGSGKSTLLRAITGLLHLSSGNIKLMEKPIKSFTRQQQARLIAVVPAVTHPTFSFTVREIVELGRHPHLGRFKSPGKIDAEAVDTAMELADVAHLAKRSIDHLSSGELQRVIIARALAQQPRILLLDEPTAHLDIGHQLDIFTLLRKLSEEHGIGTICISHDINLAAEYCPQIALFSEGRIFTSGTATEVVTEENLLSVYGALVCVAQNPHSGQPHILVTRAPIINLETEE